jgi:dihydroneopterin aldolase
MLATMSLNGMHFHAFHGALEVERELGQVLEIDLSLAYVVQVSRMTSETQPQVLYATVFEQVQKVVMSTKYKALEGLALEIARRVLQVFDRPACHGGDPSQAALHSGDIRSADVELTVDREDLSDSDATTVMNPLLRFSLRGSLGGVLRPGEDPCAVRTLQRRLTAGIWQRDGSAVSAGRICHAFLRTTSWRPRLASFLRGGGSGGHRRSAWET